MTKRSKYNKYPHLSGLFAKRPEILDSAKILLKKEEFLSAIMEKLSGKNDSLFKLSEKDQKTIRKRIENIINEARLTAEDYIPQDIIDGMLDDIACNKINIKLAEIDAEVENLYAKYRVLKILLVVDKVLKVKNPNGKTLEEQFELTNKGKKLYESRYNILSYFVSFLYKPSTSTIIETLCKNKAQELCKNNFSARKILSDLPDTKVFDTLGNRKKLRELDISGFPLLKTAVEAAKQDIIENDIKNINKAIASAISIPNKPIDHTEQLKFAFESMYIKYAPQENLSRELAIDRMSTWTLDLQQVLNDPLVRNNLYTTDQSGVVSCNKTFIEYITNKMPYVRPMLFKYLNNNKQQFADHNTTITFNDEFYNQLSKKFIEIFDNNIEMYRVINDNKGTTELLDICTILAQNQFLKVNKEGLSLKIQTKFLVFFNDLLSNGIKKTFQHIIKVYQGNYIEYIKRFILYMIDNPGYYQILETIKEPLANLLAVNRQTFKDIAIDKFLGLYADHIQQIKQHDNTLPDNFKRNITKLVDDICYKGLQNTNILTLLKATSNLLNALAKNDSNDISTSITQFIDFIYSNPDLKDLTTSHHDIIKNIIELEAIKRNFAGTKKKYEVSSQSGLLQLTHDYYKSNMQIAHLISDIVRVITNIDDRKVLISAVQNLFSGNNEKFREALVNLFEVFAQSGGQTILNDNQELIKKIIAEQIEEQQKNKGFARTYLEAKNSSERIYNILYTVFSNTEVDRLLKARKKLVKDIAELFKVKRSKHSQNETIEIPKSLFDNAEFWQPIDAKKADEMNTNYDPIQTLKSRTFFKTKIMDLDIEIEHEHANNMIPEVVADITHVLSSTEDVANTTADLIIDILNKQYAKEIDIFQTSLQELRNDIKALLKNIGSSYNEDIKQIVDQILKIPGILRSSTPKDFASTISNLVKLINSNDSNTRFIESKGLVSKIIGYQLSKMNLLNITKTINGNTNPEHITIYNLLGQMITDIATSFVLKPDVAKKLDHEIQQIFSGNNDSIAEGLFELLQTLRENGASGIMDNPDYCKVLQYIVSQQIKKMQSPEKSENVINYLNPDETARKIVALVYNFIANDNINAEKYKRGIVETITKMFKGDYKSNITLESPEFGTTFIEQEFIEQKNSLFRVNLPGNLDIYIPSSPEIKPKIVQVVTSAVGMLLSSKSLSDEIKSFSNLLIDMARNRNQTVIKQGFYYSSNPSMPLKLLTLITPEQASAHLIPFMKTIVELHKNARDDVKQDIQDIIKLIIEDRLEINENTVNKLTKTAITLLESTKNDPGNDKILEHISFLTTRLVLTDPRISYKIKGFDLSEKKPQTAFIKPLILPLLKCINEISINHDFNVSEPNWYLKLVEYFLIELSKKDHNHTKELLKTCLENENARVIMSSFMRDIDFLNQTGISAYDVLKVLDKPDTAAKILDLYRSIYNKEKNSIETQNINKKQALLTAFTKPEITKIIGKVLLHYITRIVEFFCRLFMSKVYMSKSINRQLQQLNGKIPEGSKTKLDARDVFKNHAKNLTKTAPNKLSIIQRFKDGNFSNLVINQPIKNLRLDNLDFSHSIITTDVFQNVLIGESVKFDDTKFRLPIIDFNEIKNNNKNVSTDKKKAKEIIMSLSKNEIAEQFNNLITEGSIRFTSIKAANNFIKALEVQGIILSQKVLNTLKNTKFNKKGISVVGFTGAEIRNRKYKEHAQREL